MICCRDIVGPQMDAPALHAPATLVHPCTSMQMKASASCSRSLPISDHPWMEEMQ